MRRFKLQTQVTADGYMAGPNGEMDWTAFPFSADMESYIEVLTESVDTIVLGRNLAEGFIPHWASEPEGEPVEYSNWVTETRKVVISSSLDGPLPDWQNTEVAGGELAGTIDALKAEDGGDLIAFGGGTLVRSLVGEGLLDELHLFVNPTSIGEGMPVFPAGEGSRSFDLVDAKRFDCGIAVVNYEPKD